MNKITTEQAAGLILGILVIVPILCLLMGFPFMWIWNFAVVSAISIAKPITFWQSFWLMMFITIFVKSHNASVSKK
jgi:hypothetical protein